MYVVCVCSCEHALFGVCANVCVYVFCFILYLCLLCVFLIVMLYVFASHMFVFRDYMMCVCACVCGYSVQLLCGCVFRCVRVMCLCVWLCGCVVCGLCIVV